jgi:hypothetical protein
MKKAMVAAAVVGALSMAVLGTRSAWASSADDVSEVVTAEEVNAVIDARLHELLKQKLAELNAGTQSPADAK